MKDDGGRATGTWHGLGGVGSAFTGTTLVVVTDVLFPLEYAVTHAQGMQDLSFQIYSSFSLWCWPSNRSLRRSASWQASASDWKKLLLVDCIPRNLRRQDWSKLIDIDEKYLTHLLESSLRATWGEKSLFLDLALAKLISASFAMQSVWKHQKMSSLTYLDTFFSPARMYSTVIAIEKGTREAVARTSRLISGGRSSIVSSATSHKPNVKIGC